MSKITMGIRFGDNDFGHTFWPLLEQVFANLSFKPTKQQVVEICNELTVGFYLAFQNGYSHHADKSEIRSYLQIDESNVLLDQEVLDYTLETGTHNYAFFCLIDGSYYCY